MSERWPGGIISATAPVVTGPTGGEGGSAPGIWTMDQANYYIANGQWPLPTIAGGLYGWGLNNAGQLGIGNTTDYSSPKQVGLLTSWENVSISTGTASAIKGGTIWAWGDNGSGQLGLGNTTNYSSPKQIGALTNWKSITAGASHIIALKNDGSLWSWGGNGGGRLGLGNTTYYSSPKQVGSLTTWAYATAVSSASFGIKTDGTLWAWGANGINGVLGLNNNTSYSSPVQVGSLTNWLRVIGGITVYALKTDGTLWSWGYNLNGRCGLNGAGGAYVLSPNQVGALTTWSKIGRSHATGAAIKTDGTLWSWGYGAFGTVGLGNNTYSNPSPAQVGSLTTWLSVSGGQYNACAIQTNGTLWTWGDNSSGQLGLGDTSRRSSPVQVGSLTTWKKVPSSSGRGDWMLAIGS